MSSRILFLTIGLLIVGFVASHFHESSKNEKARESRKQQEEIALRQLITKFSAVDNWHEKFKKINTPYTFEIKEALIRPDKAPILFHGHLEDVSKEQSGFLLSFESWSATPNMRFELRCTSEQAKEIVDMSRHDQMTDFEIVARINDVRKPRFSVTALPSGEEASLELGSSDVFIASGELLGFIVSKY